MGIAEFVQETTAPFPVGGIDLFQLSQHKSHIIYPITVSNNEWVVLLSTEFISTCDYSKLEIRIVDENKAEMGKLSFFELKEHEVPTTSDSNQGPNQETSNIVIYKKSEFIIIHFKVDMVINRPGNYFVQLVYDGNVVEIGSAIFHYNKAPSLTPDQIKALDADPNSFKTIKMELGCKYCSTKLYAYTGLKRQQELEQNGYIWQTELADKFKCKCGKTNISLEYLKESMHGLLRKDIILEVTGLSYVRRYGHAQVENIVNEFYRLLDKERLEEPVQSYIETHPMLLSRFHAKRLYVKPDIIGRFKADFAIVDSRNQLVFIELERPSISLFKTDGHPTAALMHAYGQVTDWLHQYNSYQGAILDSLGLKPEEVVGVRGAIIAGRSTALIHSVIQRHLANPPYQNIEFMTIDDLGSSLLTISRKLA